MTTKNFFTYQAILNLIFGIPLLFVPQMLTDMYGTPHTDTTGTVETLSRAYGTALIGLGVCAFMVRQAQPSLARNAFLFATFVSGLLTIIVHVRAINLGFENYTGWVTVLLLVVLVVWSGLLVSKEDRKVLE